MEISYSELLKNVTQSSFEGVYFLQGDEPFFIDHILDHLMARVIESGQKSFNQFILYGKDTSMEEVISTARKYPMMGERQLVLIREAQEMKGWNREQDQKLLMDYLSQPMPCTVLAFGYKYKRFDKRTVLAKSLTKSAVFMNSKRLYDNQIIGWIAAYAQAIEVKITPQAVQMLAENIGNDLKRIANEFDKLKPNINEGQAIDELLIDKYVGISKAFNTFELQKAIGQGDGAKAFQIVQYFAQNPSANPLILTLFSLYSYFTKLLQLHTAGTRDKAQLARIIGTNPYFVDEYLAAAQRFNQVMVLRNLDHIYQADLQAKGIGAVNKKELDVLNTLIYQLLS